MKKVRINDKIEIIYVDSYKKYNKENSYGIMPKKYNEKNNFRKFVKLFGFMMYFF